MILSMKFGTPFKTIIGATLCLGLNAWANIQGRTEISNAKVWGQPNASQRPMGVLKKGTVVQVVSKTADGQFVRIQVPKEDGSIASGYVKTKDLKLERALAKTPAPQPVTSEEQTTDEVEEVSSRSHRPDRQVSFGVGFGGYSFGGNTYVTVSTDARYLWVDWTESIVGVDLTFGEDTFWGYRLGQRFYAPLGSFRPYVHLGYRRFDAADSKNAAWETGGGFQVFYAGGTSFFDVGALYLSRTSFDASATNGWVFGGSSGVRF
jgi:hypothetical protein